MGRRVGVVALRSIIFVGTLLVMLVGACGLHNTEWHDSRRVPGYVVPKAIPLVVDVSERAQASDPGNSIDTMVLTVREELGERGVQAEILSPKPSRLPSPRVEIIVRNFDEGSAAGSYVSGLLVGIPVAGNAEFFVICRAYSASNALMFEGTLKGFAPGTSNTRGLAESMGDEIADGLTDPEGAKPPPPPEKGY